VANRKRPIKALLLGRTKVADGEPYERYPFSPLPALSPETERRETNAQHASPFGSWRCSMKPPLRTKSVGTKVSEAEFVGLEERARSSGLTLSEWVRDRLLSEPIKEGPELGEVALAELLALRSLFLNINFRAAKGEPVSESELRGLIERADATKLERARERLQAVRTQKSQPKEVAEDDGMGS